MTDFKEPIGLPQKDEPRGIAPFEAEIIHGENANQYFIESPQVPFGPLGKAMIFLDRPKEEELKRAYGKDDEGFTFDEAGNRTVGNFYDLIRRGYYEVSVHFENEYETTPLENHALQYDANLWLDGLAQTQVSDVLETSDEREPQALFTSFNTYHYNPDGSFHHVTHFVMPDTPATLKKLRLSVSTRR